MTITSTLHNALSGLAAVSRSADVVSSNVANALTEGYARRELSLSAQSLGGNGAGVSVDAVTRAVNQTVLADRRLADAELANADVRSAFLAQVEGRIGTPDDAGSLSARLTELESALIEAASRPDSEARLGSVLTAAKNVTKAVAAISGAIQQSRMEADSGIASAVNSLNGMLVEIRDLNVEITSARASGRDATALMDQRQTLVDKVSEIVPVREVPRQGDQVALFTTGGAVLLEGTPARIGFTAVGVIAPDMTMTGGALFGLTLNGMPISPSDTGVMGGGRLGALFAVRDDLAVTAQTQIDALARDLIGRFQSSAVDPTLGPGSPGLFTDSGNSLNVADEVGLSARLSVNALADPSRGGSLWRLRDGLGAAMPGPVGDATLLNALSAALADPVTPASGSFGGAARSASGLAADILSQIAGARQSAEDAQGYASARQEALTVLQLQDGVDTDREMQMLLVIEQAYAANARVIKTVDELIQQLIGM
ncbi:flagellar hook-associated protein FlgK [Ostreiculturibacter nitratireducens]|uniref:flagellar hook-associated protein FlgK n=1 Tax=Ostreiculturibacter nitratireducens TaxID=3075226 RepID=UPI0031B5B92A